MFVLKRRSHLRHLRNQPRGTTLLAYDTPSNAESSLSSGHSSDTPGMRESTFGAGVTHPGFEGLPAAYLAAAPHSGHAGPHPYQLSKSTPAGGSAFLTPSVAAYPAAAHDDHLSSRPLIDIEAAQFSDIPSLPSPHEQPIQSDIIGISAFAHRQSRFLPDPPPSTTYADLEAFQKDLERDQEKRNQPSGSGRVHASDPPPVYSD
ncbi:hypothetical protein H0H87_005480 [Tephrocybe sp. NHM501043]|nr:hypothetical protein H0H87_005480 [Tephrocybe sp. NHM501043]